MLNTISSIHRIGSVNCSMWMRRKCCSTCSMVSALAHWRDEDDDDDEWSTDEEDSARSAMTNTKRTKLVLMDTMFSRFFSAMNEDSHRIKNQLREAMARLRKVFDHSLTFAWQNNDN